MKQWIKSFSTGFTITFFALWNQLKSLLFNTPWFIRFLWSKTKDNSSNIYFLFYYYYWPQNPAKSYLSTEELSWRFKKESDILSNFRSKEIDLIIYVFHFPVTRLCLLSVRLSVLRGWTFSKVPWLLADINRVAWLLLVLVLTVPCPYPFHRPLYW